MKSNSYSFLIPLIIHLPEVLSILTLPLYSARDRGYPQQNRPARSKRSTEDVVSSSLQYNDAHYGFFVNISVGTPPQEVSLLLTTASHTWLAAEVSEACSGNASSSTRCRYGKESGYFDVTKSSTLSSETASFQMTYPDKSYISGLYTRDTVHFSSSSISSVSFITSSDYSAFPSLGLGLSTDPSHESFPQALVQNGVINSTMYAISYDGDVHSTAHASLMFDAVDTNAYTGDLLTVPFENNAASIPLAKLNLQLSASSSNTLLESFSAPVQAEVQIGTSSLWLPGVVLEPIYQLLGSKYDTTLGAQIVDCSRRSLDISTALKFTFVSDNKSTNITLPISSLVAPLHKAAGEPALGSDGKPICFVLTRDSSLLPHAKVVLGAPLQRGAYVVTDLTRKQISIAPLAANTTVRNVVSIPSGVGLDSFNPRGTAKAHGQSKKPAIIGGAVGAALILCSLVGIIIWARNRRSKTKNLSDYATTDDGADAPEFLDGEAVNDIDKQKIAQKYHLKITRATSRRDGEPTELAEPQNSLPEADSHALHEMLHDASVVRGLPDEELYVNPERDGDWPSRD